MFSMFLTNRFSVVMEVLLWERRNEKELSDRALVKLSGLGKSTINNIETEKTSPTLKKLKAIAVALDCKITNLFDDEYK